MADQLNVANINAQLQRGCRNQGTQLAGFERLFGLQAVFTRQAAVVGSDSAFTKTLRQMPGEPFGQATC